KIGYATFYRKGLAADSNTTVGMTTTAAGVAEVFVYRGVDTTLTTSCPSATCMIRQAAAAPTGANSTTLTFPTITTAMASEEVVGTKPAGVAYQPSAGGTIYYNGNGSGQFTISDPITDAESGPRSVTYPAVATSGWTHALETVSTGSSYTSSAYQWAAGTHT